MKMAIVKQRGNILYIQWYDPLSKKVQSKTIGLSATESNKKKAKNYAKKLQEELTKKTRKMKELDIASGRNPRDLIRISSGKISKNSC